MFFPHLKTSEMKVAIAAGTVELEGELAIPAGARGIVLFAHGHGGSRRSQCNELVAGVLRARGLATLRFDLLTADEEMQDEIDAGLRPDVERLGARVVVATDWVRQAPLTRGMSVGVFGASAGAARR